MTKSVLRGCLLDISIAHRKIIYAMIRSIVMTKNIWLCVVTWLELPIVSRDKNSEKRKGENFIPKMLNAMASRSIIIVSIAMIIRKNIFQTRDDVYCEMSIHPYMTRTVDRIWPRRRSSLTPLIHRHHTKMISWKSEIYRYVSTTPITKANHPLTLMKRCIIWSRQ